MRMPERGAAPRLSVDAAGWIAGARRIASPHFDARPDGARIELLVLHSISLPPGCFGGDAIERLFTGTLDPAADASFAPLAGLRVAAHVVIARDGAATQYVSFNDRAWHAGASEFEGRPRCNDYSIGLELEGTDHAPFEAVQYDVLARIAAALDAAYPSLRAVRRHSDIAPARKTDPGPYFDWPRFVRAMPAHWSLPAGVIGSS
ncbi:MAG TPA: 1,6-anhydro-N-acetylmuramyl-L-alanine amidase AmpD [Burkholderiaceae bacterium]|nr:1,6-anhydro-N-acetylmuramyl-L-alanine amidase AmpD [Burkholderiaceae bacterium]